MENEYTPKYNRQAFATCILDLNNSSNSKYGIKELLLQCTKSFFILSYLEYKYTICQYLIREKDCITAEDHDYKTFRSQIVERNFELV